MKDKQAHPVLKYRVPYGSPSPHANSFVKGPAVINNNKQSAINMYCRQKEVLQTL